MDRCDWTEWQAFLVGCLDPAPENRGGRWEGQVPSTELLQMSDAK